MRELVGAVLSHAQTVAVLSGLLATILTSVARLALGAPRWQRWSWLARVVVVAIVAALVALGTGWANGLVGGELVSHALSVFVSSLGLRQLLKRFGAEADDERRRRSLRTPFPGGLI